MNLNNISPFNHDNRLTLVNLYQILFKIWCSYFICLKSILKMTTGHFKGVSDLVSKW